MKKELQKLKPGDKVAILSPSFAAPGVWPHVYNLGIKRVRDVFNLEPIEFPTTTKVNSSAKDRTKDIIAAYEDPSILAIITSIGGDDQVTYIKNLPIKPFIENPKPFFGFSDNTHLANFLWLCGIPSYYGGSLFTQFAMQVEMDDYTIDYLKFALFENGEKELIPSKEFNDIGLNWYDVETLNKKRIYEKNSGWVWSGRQHAEGKTWGGCLESIDEMLRHKTQIPTIKQFEDIILITETSEEIPSHDYVFRFYRALGERGILEKIKGVMVGRPKAWNFDKQLKEKEREEYRQKQQETITRTVRMYNKKIPIVQNMDFGHTDPQIPMPYGFNVKIDSVAKKIIASF